MIPYVTNRGGPLIGIEALALQGIPADELLLTRETEDQLADLAGNAMSSTVVGVCLVSALILASDLFEEQEPQQVDADDQAKAEVVDAALSAVGRRVEAHITGQDRLTEYPLNLAISEKMSIRAILKQAAQSARYCLCEGPTGTSGAATLLCDECGHTRCNDCSPKPIHQYSPHPYSASRIAARDFGKTLKGVLPMRLTVSGLSKARLNATRESSAATISDSDWKLWSNAIVDGLKDTEFHFRGLDRKHHWIATFVAPKAYLRLSIHENKAVWLLFISAPTSDNANSRRRTLLKQPVARLEIDPEHSDLLSGPWALYLPASEKVKISITGVGETTPAWEARLGIQTLPLQNEAGKDVDKVAWQDKKQWTGLKVQVDSAALDVDINGTYNLQKDCGTAMENLHIRPATDTSPRVSLFLDPVRVGFAYDDSFVFALDHERLDFEVERVTLATLDPRWRPTDVEGAKQISAEIRGRWESIADLKLQVVEETSNIQPLSAATFASPAVQLNVDMGEHSCQSANAVLVCRVPLPHAEAEQLWTSVRDTWGEIELQHKGKQAFDALAWITERLPALTTLERWTDVVAPELPPDAETCCQQCAPVPPELSWIIKQTRLVPVEDVVQAGEYERVSSLVLFDASTLSSLIRPRAPPGPQA